MIVTFLLHFEKDGFVFEVMEYRKKLLRVIYEKCSNSEVTCIMSIIKKWN